MEKGSLLNPNGDNNVAVLMKEKREILKRVSRSVFPLINQKRQTRQPNLSPPFHSEISS
jgi:hypothetical protein